MKKLSRQARHRDIGALLLVSPLLLFLTFGFILPIGRLLILSVDNTDVVAALPRTTEAIQSWSGTNLPSDQVFEALILDLSDLEDTRLLSKAANRFNFELAGFRSVLLSTARSLKVGAPPRESLLTANPAWGDAAYWHVIRRAATPATDFYLLAAADLRWTDEGNLASFKEQGALHLQVLSRTLEISCGVTLLCLLLGYPFAYLLVIAPRPLMGVLLAVVLFPFWTSLLVRTTAWIVLLQSEGVINDLVLKLGLWDQRLQLIHNRLGVYIVMTHILVPYAVLPIYSVMRRLPDTYLKAARSLGAGPLFTFRRVYLPLTMSGVIAGATIVFILALGYYITPALVGGPKDQMISYFISYYASQSLNWGMAAALSVVLLCVALAAVGIAAVALRGSFAEAQK